MLVEAPCTSLDELMFEYMVLVMQELKWREDCLLVSRHPVCCFVFMLLSCFVHHLAQLAWLGVAWFFAVIMMMPSLFPKTLPDCHHENPTLVFEVTCTGWLKFT